MVALLILLGIAAAWATYSTALFPVGLAIAAAAFWSNGVMANYRHDPQGAPNFATTVSMLCALGAVVLIPTGLLIR